MRINAKDRPDMGFVHSVKTVVQTSAVETGNETIFFLIIRYGLFIPAGATCFNGFRAIFWGKFSDIR